jgi:cytochrome c-type biogenesis protein CcmH/NrfG
VDSIATFVLDTNVLLADPASLYAFPGARVVIPETVLGEIDKLKTMRADQDLRFRGREVSRELFALSEQGNLTDGVPMRGGGELVVVRLAHDGPLPPEYNGKSSDDRILAVAYQLAREGDGVTLVTNDLNMLLKAQAVGLTVQRHGEESERPLIARMTRGLWQRNRIPILTAIAVLLAFLAALAVVYSVIQPGQRSQVTTLPPEVEALLGTSQKDLLQNLQALQKNPNDLTALITIGNIYYDLGTSTKDFSYIQNAVTYYERAIKISPADAPVGTDLAICYYYLGRMDDAVRQVQSVIAINPKYALAYLNYGIILQNGRKDLPGAAAQYRKFIAVVGAGDPHAATARKLLAAVEASIAGTKL